MGVSVRWVVIGVLLAAALAVVAASAVILKETYQDTRERIEAQAASSAHVVATHVRWIIASSRQAFQQIDKEVVAPLADLAEPAKTEITKIIAQMPVPVSGGLIDAEGRVVFSTAGERPEVSVADRPYFTELKAGARGPVVSPLIVGRTTQSHVFVVADRIVRDGQFMGAAYISVPTTVMAEFLQALNLNKLSTVSIFRTDGWLVARYPLPDGPMNLSNYVLFTDYLRRSPSGTYPAVSPADGVRRVVGYRTVENEPLVALASIATDELFASFWTEVRWAIAALALLLLALSLVSYRLVRVMRREEKSREQLALLFREVHHRVKNNLQAVAAFIHLAPMDADIKSAMALRLRAMSAIHEQAYRSDEYADVLLSEYLGQLVDNMRSAFGEKANIAAKLEPIVVDRDQALPIGLVANEVLSNAFKYAFPAGQRGDIEISLQTVEPGQAELCVRDNGVGYDSSKPTQGLGSRLIKGFVAQLGAEANILSDKGTTFRMRFPIRRHASAA